MNLSKPPLIDNIAEEDEDIRQDIRNAESNPSDFGSWKKLAGTLLENEYYDHAKSCYDRALELNPNDIDCWYNRGLALSNLGKYDQHEAKSIEAEGKYREAAADRNHEAEGKYREAILCYDKVIKIDSNNIHALNSKGYTLRLMREFREAIKSYDRVVEIDANNVIAWYNRGLALSNLGKYDEAIKSYDRVVEIDQKNTDALNAKGLALERLGRYDEAIKSYDRALDINANNTDALYYEANLYLSLGKSYQAAGKYHEAAGKYHEAATILNQVLVCDSNNIRALESLHQLYSNYTFEFDKSLSTAKKLFDLQPNPERKIMLAEDFIKSGEYKKGRQLALEAKKEVPWEKIKRQCIIRLLILSSYLLEGDSVKGNRELVDFINFYEILENFKIDENEWNFNGLVRAINAS